MEPLLHFTIPFLILLAIGFKPVKAFIYSMIALTPDLDIFFWHRLSTHAPLLILSLLILSLWITRLFKPKYFNIILLAFVMIFIHIFLDVFTNYVAIAWPFSNLAVKVVLEATMDPSKPASSLNSIVRLEWANIQDIPRSYETYVISGIGVGAIVLTILAFTCLKLKDRIKLSSHLKFISQHVT